MSSTLATLTGALRSLLFDTVGMPVWSDDALHQALWEAIAEHSFLFPKRVRALFTVSAGNTALPLYAVDTLTPQIGPSFGPLVPSSAADILGVVRVELPAGTPIVQDPQQIADPAGSGSCHYAQAWNYAGGLLYLRNPASGLEVGSNTLLVDMLQTYSRPDLGNTISWDGPVHDLSLVYLLAERDAYQQFVGWQGRDGDSPALAKVVPNIPSALVLLEAEITRALALRSKRSVHSRTLDL